MSKLSELSEIQARLEAKADAGNTIAGALAADLLLIIGAISEVASSGGVDTTLHDAKFSDIATALGSVADRLGAIETASSDISTRVAALENAVSVASSRLSNIEEAFSSKAETASAKTKG